MGHLERNIAKQAYREGRELPDRVKNAPELKPGLELYLTAFFDLDTERHHGNGICAIPISSIAGYARIFEFDSEQTEDLFFYIREMDDAHIKRMKQRLDAAKSNKRYK